MSDGWTNGGLKAHPLANLFPMIEDEGAQQRLADDIMANGLMDRIVIHEGMILDGRNRYRACVGNGLFDGEDDEQEPVLSSDWFVPFGFQVPGWHKDLTPLAWVLSKNLHRRHLDDAQRALVAARLANMRQGERTDREPSANLQEDEAPKISQAEAADLLNVSARSVSSAKQVLDHAAPEVVEALEQGKIAVSTAEALSELPKEQQADIVGAGGKKEIREAVKAALPKDENEVSKDISEPTSVDQPVIFTFRSGKQNRATFGVCLNADGTFGIEVNHQFGWSGGGGTKVYGRFTAFWPALRTAGYYLAQHLVPLAVDNASDAKARASALTWLRSAFAGWGALMVDMTGSDAHIPNDFPGSIGSRKRAAEATDQSEPPAGANTGTSGEGIANRAETELAREAQGDPQEQSPTAGETAPPSPLKLTGFLNTILSSSAPPKIQINDGDDERFVEVDEQPEADRAERIRFMSPQGKPYVSFAALVLAVVDGQQSISPEQVYFLARMMGLIDEAKATTEAFAQHMKDVGVVTDDVLDAMRRQDAAKTGEAAAHSASPAVVAQLDYADKAAEGEAEKGSAWHAAQYAEMIGKLGGMRGHLTMDVAETPLKFGYSARVAVKQIAEDLGHPVGTVKTWANRLGLTSKERLEETKFKAGGQ